MEVYILDDLFRRNTVIDRFESCIWTERYSSYGDFQLVIHSNVQSRSQLVEGTRLAINRSKRVMTIENVQDTDSSEGRRILTVTGRSLEASMEDRAVRPNLNGSAQTPYLIPVAAPPADILRALVQYICITGGLDPKDVIPFLTMGNLYPVNTIAEPDQVISVGFPPRSLYDTVKELCDIYGLGFRLYRGPDDSTLYFNIYTGDDRTATQMTLPAVIFAPDLENFSNTTEFRTIEKHKNVALVVGKTQSVWVYADNDAENATGTDRRVLTLEVGDIDEDKPYELNDTQDALITELVALSTNAAIDISLEALRSNVDMTPTEMTDMKAFVAGSGSVTADKKSQFLVITGMYELYRTNFPIVTAALQKKGQDELTKYKVLRALDGEVSVNSKYRYGIDYELGDLVETRNEDGLTNRMRVTEQIFVDDKEGERAYPTLALDIFITPGTWYAWDSSGVWDTAPGVWDDQPE